MTYQEAIYKATKLLRLAQSSNQHEAALAAARAQEIMDRFKIESLSISEQSAPEEPIKDFRNDPLETELKSKVAWKIQLASAVARHNQCRIYIMGGPIAIVGRPSDVTTVRYLYGWLVREVNRIAGRDTAGYGRIYSNNFRLGMIDTIRERLAEQRQQTDSALRAEAAQNNGLALVIVNKALTKRSEQLAQVDRWMQSNLRLNKGRSSHIATHATAREAGRLAGTEIRFTHAKGSLGAGCRQLNATV